MDSNKTEYVVVEAHRVTNLVDSVNEWLKIGFKPIGGVTVATTRVIGYGVETIYCQALIKE